MMIVTDMPRDERQITVGRITARLLGGGGVEIIRKGSPGKGATARDVMWHLEQIESAWIAASSRKGQDAQDQAKALRWALEEMAGG